MEEFVVANKEHIKEGQILKVKAGEIRLILVCAKKGEYYAVEDKCSHADVSLSSGKLEVEGDSISIECPAHGARFDCKTGMHLCMPAVAPIKSYVVKERDNGDLVVLI